MKSKLLSISALLILALLCSCTKQKKFEWLEKEISTGSWTVTNYAVQYSYGIAIDDVLYTTLGTLTFEAGGTGTYDFDGTTFPITWSIEDGDKQASTLNLEIEQTLLPPVTQPLLLTVHPDIHNVMSPYNSNFSPGYIFTPQNRFQLGLNAEHILCTPVEGSGYDRTTHFYLIKDETN